MTVFLNWFLMHSCIFSIIPPVFSVTWSSEIIIIYWFSAQETFSIIAKVETVVLLGIFVETIIAIVNININFIFLRV